MTSAPNERRRYVVLIGSMAMLLVSGGGMFLIVVSLKAVATEFDWPRAVPSFAFSLQFIGSGFGGIVMGYVLDRFGFGVPALVGAIMVGSGGLLVSRIDAAWQLYLIYGIMFGLSGQGSLAAPALANIARWFDRRRGMAVGMVSSGTALAGIVWPPIFGLVMAAVGWRDMFFWFGVFALCAMLPLCLAVRFKPPPYVRVGRYASTASRRGTDPVAVRHSMHIVFRDFRLLHGDGVTARPYRCPGHRSRPSDPECGGGVVGHADGVFHQPGGAVGAGYRPPRRATRHVRLFRRSGRHACRPHRGRCPVVALWLGRALRIGLRRVVPGLFGRHP
jgi:hypothetical protein